MKASERLVALLERLAELAEAPPERIAEGLRAELARFDLRACAECGRSYLHIGYRHYRCHHCRWKRHLVASNQSAPGGSRQSEASGTPKPHRRL